MSKKNSKINKDTKKLYVTAYSLWKDSFRLGRMIYDSGFRPDVLLIVLRGGALVGVIIHEFFQFKGVKIEHAAIKAVSYKDIGKQGEVKIFGVNQIAELNKKDEKGNKERTNLLIVDDVFDSGRTVEKIYNSLPETFNKKIATIYYKPRNNKTNLKPHYCIRETDKWIVFPHEIMGLTEKELEEKSKEIYRIIKE